MHLKVAVDLSDGGARAQAAHDRDQVAGVNLALVRLVVQGETLLELCVVRDSENAEEATPARQKQHRESNESNPPIFCAHVHHTQC